MKVKRFALTSISTLLAIALLSGCSIFKTPLTDELKLKAEYTGQTFTDPQDGNNAIGEVTLVNVVDGDTFDFVDGVYDDVKKATQAPLAFRFLGVNTPESTARIEPWGVKASQWVKSILWDEANNKQKPYRIVLQNDYQVFGQTESNDRYLGFVWYKMNEGSEFRLLNLEIIEHCYSINNLSEFSVFCPYLDYFVAASKVAKASGKRVYGEKDPGYDYTNSILNVTIRDIRENFENYGVSDTAPEASGDSGIKLRISALIVSFSANNAILRDVTNAYPDGTHATIYAFTSLTVTTMAINYEIGQIITFICRATTYSNNIQLTDIQDKQALGDEWRIIPEIDKPSQAFAMKTHQDWEDEAKLAALKKAVHDRGVEKGIKEGWDYDFMPYDLIEPINNVKDVAELEQYVGTFAKIHISVREGDENDETPTQGETTKDFYRWNADKDRLIVFTFVGSNVKLNIRALKYTKGDCARTELYKVGTTYCAIGLISKYYDTYELQIANNYPSFAPSFAYDGETPLGHLYVVS